MAKLNLNGLNVVLFEPEIPQNTGNIARTCAAVGAKLHLIKPLGFSLRDRYLKRAGLDYWSAFFQDPEDDPPGPSHILVEAYTAEGGDLQEVSSENEPGGCSHGTNVATIIAGNLSIADNHPNGGNLMHYYDWGGQTRGNVADHFPVRLYIQDFGYLESDTCQLGDFDFTAAINKAYNTYDSKIHQNSWNYDNLAGSYSEVWHLLI